MGQVVRRYRAVLTLKTLPPAAALMDEDSYAPPSSPRRAGSAGEHMPGSKPLSKSVASAPAVQFGTIRTMPVESAAAARQRVAAAGN
jgi:hypothetical protein